MGNMVCECKSETPVNVRSVNAFMFQALSNAAGVFIAGTPVFIYAVASGAKDDEMYAQVAIGALIVVAALLALWGARAIAGRLPASSSANTADSGDASLAHHDDEGSVTFEVALTAIPVVGILFGVAWMVAQIWR
ncbi:hypothetical protein [Leucobacter aridicollis]|uniref:hypothetical protein n=1 Tax=Leucobacter aridicollis TaxID=283878 RepID=UPI000E64DFE6|nr:hypothetical protein [Leucobacter aridicollis]UTX54478.1 hypothetical protein KI794_07330 [Leucobacter aridicollis]